LQQVREKELDVNGYLYKVQFNPARLVSSAAKVDDASIRERKCFLCPDHFPEEQKGIAFNGHYRIWVNPFPVFTRHYTVIEQEHVKQRILPRFDDMLSLAKKLDDCVVFYNGPKCGASAPDHAHFQVGNKGFLPVEKDWKNLRTQEVATQGKAVLRVSDDFPCTVLIVESDNKADAIGLFHRLYEALKRMQPDEDEPMMNIVVWYEKEVGKSCIFPRRKHRPSCYFSQGEGNILISPASVDMGGVFILPLEKDFDKITAVEVAAILKEVGMSPSGFRQLNL
jgi:ATP adenylyltransferase/5',5'''-P-1,P-4-tetraphosphate phosphorylase II